jgi:hypothetical protein
MKLLIPCFLAAALACAQSTAQLEIRGTVVEGTLGIGGVTVTLYNQTANASTRSVAAVTFTDATGKFTFHPARTGEYYVEVKKEGYFAESSNGPARDPADSTGGHVSIDADHPLRERKYSLIRLGEIRGRFIDEDGNPLAKLHVVIQTPPSSLFREFVQAVTDQDGTFAGTKLRPGDYQVRISLANPDVLTQFSEDDLKIVNQNWEASSWPAVPLSVRSGSSLNVGTITARKARYYRAHLSISGDCAEGEKWTFSVKTAGTDFGLVVPCAKDFLVRNLAPGSYAFSLSTSGRPKEMKVAFASVEVIDRNLESGLTLSSGTDINGQLKAADGATLPPGKIMITVSPIDPTDPLTGSQAIAPDPGGRFLICCMIAVRQHVHVEGLANKFYVQEIRYNGMIVSNGIFTPISGAPGLLDIVIDDQAAILSGTVAEGDKVSGQVGIVAVKWPLSPEGTSLEALLSSNVPTLADDQGRFQIGGLAPGDYRVLALTKEGLIRNADNLIRLINDAEKVTLERGGSQNISLKLIDPSQ